MGGEKEIKNHQRGVREKKGVHDGALTIKARKKKRRLGPKFYSHQRGGKGGNLLGKGKLPIHRRKAKRKLGDALGEKP